MESFRLCSHTWHQALGLVAQPEVMAMEPTPVHSMVVASAALTSATRHPPVPSGRLSHWTAYLEALSKVVGRQVRRFKSPTQMEALCAVLDGSRDILVVLPTGGGKSAMFLVPAILEEHAFTILVVPYVALAQDLMVKCARAGIEALQFSQDLQPEDAGGM
jgi:superfamily II DNA helicase RecQ